MSKDDSLLKSNTDWARLDQMGDEDIDLSDIPELTDEQLQVLRPARQVLAERGMQSMHIVFTMCRSIMMMVLQAGTPLRRTVMLFC